MNVNNVKVGDTVTLKHSDGSVLVKEALWTTSGGLVIPFYDGQAVGNAPYLNYLVKQGGYKLIAIQKPKPKFPAKRYAIIEYAGYKPFIRNGISFAKPWMNSNSLETFNEESLINIWGSDFTVLFDGID